MQKVISQKACQTNTVRARSDRPAVFGPGTSKS